MLTCNRLDLESLGFLLTLYASHKLPGHCLVVCLLDTVEGLIAGGKSIVAVV
jgi:hypothetical protein